MNIGEYFRGTSEEREILFKAENARRRKTRGEKTKDLLADAHRVSRALFIRRLAGGLGVATVAVTPVGILLANELRKPPQHEAVRRNDQLYRNLASGQISPELLFDITADMRSMADYPTIKETGDVFQKALVDPTFLERYSPTLAPMGGIKVSVSHLDDKTLATYNDPVPFDLVPLVLSRTNSQNEVHTYGVVPKKDAKAQVNIDVSDKLITNRVSPMVFRLYLAKEMSHPLRMQEQNKIVIEDIRKQGIIVPKEQEDTLIRTSAQARRLMLTVDGWLDAIRNDMPTSFFNARTDLDLAGYWSIIPDFATAVLKKQITGERDLEACDILLKATLQAQSKGYLPGNKWNVGPFSPEWVSIISPLHNQLTT
jgi:hypothetical protein